ncbi:MAG: DUF4350 domain-containing protein, partial [Gammaproteobacteria bacterium]|nr:DUF4350 domain-containing protein [Gammaproteobacteria bacterium]
QILLYILLLLISLASGYWFYNNFSWVNEEKEVGFQGLAKTNKLLASEFFLRKMGINVQQVNGLLAFRDLPSTRHTLLIATQRETINKELSQKLLSWVHAGGHLIVEARYIAADKIKKDNNESAINDDLLEELMIFSRRSDACECKVDENNEEIPVIVSLSSDDYRSAENAYQLMGKAKNTEIEVNFPYDKTLQKNSSESPITWLVKDDVGQYLMQIPLEKGLITVLTSTSIFNNNQIAQYDHARFLHYLLQQQEHDEGVWLIRVDDMPSLWQWLWTNAWPVMFSLSLLFLFWLWRAPLRFGPLLNDEQMPRRSLLEHIQASGYYRWHNNQSGYLLTKVQNILWNKIQAAHPAVRREDQAQAYVKLEEITGVKESSIKQSLTTVDKITEQEFVNRIRILEMIRKHL